MNPTAEFQERLEVQPTSDLSLPQDENPHEPMDLYKDAGKVMHELSGSSSYLNTGSSNTSCLVNGVSGAAEARALSQDITYIAETAYGYKKMVHQVDLTGKSSYREEFNETSKFVEGLDKSGLLVVIGINKVAADVREDRIPDLQNISKLIGGLLTNQSAIKICAISIDDSLGSQSDFESLNGQYDVEYPFQNQNAASARELTASAAV